MESRPVCRIHGRDARRLRVGSCRQRRRVPRRRGCVRANGSGPVVFAGRSRARRSRNATRRDAVRRPIVQGIPAVHARERSADHGERTHRRRAPGSRRRDLSRLFCRNATAAPRRHDVRRSPPADAVHESSARVPAERIARSRNARRPLAGRSPGARRLTRRCRRSEAARCGRITRWTTCSPRAPKWARPSHSTTSSPRSASGFRSCSSSSRGSGCAPAIRSTIASPARGRA